MSQINVKVTSASLNQTVVNFTRNVPNILAAIDRAAEDGSDILSLQELGLTGYSGDDYFKWIRTDNQQKEMLELVQYIADYAAKKDPNLVLSVGFPFLYADKTQPVKRNLGTEKNPILVDNPLYNINNRPFNSVATISGGKIHAISAKSIQPDGPAEYEPRQFTSWPDYLGTQAITLSTGQTVPFGKPVVQLGTGQEQCSIYHEICAEGWPGIGDDGSINQKEMDEGRYLSRLAKQQDISLVINPSASKPEPFLDKPVPRHTLCKTGSALTGGGYVYTNCSGVEAAPTAFEAGSIFANNGTITHTGERYNMADVIYTSASLSLPVPERSKPDAIIQHSFKQTPGKNIGGPAAWESLKGNERTYEEITRNTTLWLRDYLKKTNQQGFFISLSGGQDSAFGAVMVSQMIDLNLAQLEKTMGDKQQALDAFVDQFENLDYADAVKHMNHKQGTKAATDYLKSKMLTCAYLPGENSSKFTEDAARFLIEGGTAIDVKQTDATGNETQKTLYFDPSKDRIEGDTLIKWVNDTTNETYPLLAQHEPVQGIGGTFHVVNVQPIIDTYMETFAGLDTRNLNGDQQLAVRQELKSFLRGDTDTLSPETEKRLSRRMPSWANKRDDALLQNIQARARLPMAWLFGNDERKIACVTSNWSEAVAGYWTFGGDGHMGSINICGGVPKSDLRNALRYLQTQGLDGLSTVPSLGVVNGNAASAELRPLKDGQIAQFDEDDMMPYEQLDALARTMIIDKYSPVETYKKLCNEQRTFPDGSPLFRSNEELLACIDEVCWRWSTSQFKRVAAVITPFLGQNVDPHTAVRTTIIGDGFRIGRAQLKLEYVKDSFGGEANFAQQTGTSFTDFMLRTKINQGLRDTIIDTPLESLATALQQPDFVKTKHRTICIS